MPNKYRVGVIGHTGRGNYGHGLDTVWQHVPGCEIVAVADADETGLAAAVNRLKAPQGYADYRKMLDAEKPDLVSIAPRFLDEHHDMLLAAAEHGAHVYMEKPLCPTLEQADAMVRACEEHKVKLALAYQTRYSPKLQTIRDMIDDGKIGDLVEIRARGKEDGRGGGEDLWVLGPHLMNLIQFFAGEPRWCFASLLQDGHPVGKDDVHEGKEGIGPLAGDNINAMYGHDDGVTTYFGTRRNGGPDGSSGRRFGLALYGTAGVIDMVTGYLPTVRYLPEVRWSAGEGRAKWIPVSSAGPGEAEPLNDGGHEAGNVSACLDLIESIEQDRQPESSVYEARSSTEMIVAAFDSHRAGGPVAMPLKNRRNPLTMLTG